MNVKGKIIKIMPKLEGETQKGRWSKDTFIIEVSGNEYTKYLAIDVFNEKITIPVLNTIVNVSINIESREYNGKWYTSVNAWKIEADAIDKKPLTNNTESNINDDLPF